MIDLPSARPVVTALGWTPVGTDPQVRGALHGLLVASGTPGDADERIKRMAYESDMVTRPWSWLSAVAEQANREGEYDLAAMACVFAVYWTDVMSPKLKLGDFLELGVDPAPASEKTRLLMAGVAAVATMPAERIVVGDANDGMPAGRLLNLWRSMLG